MDIESADFSSMFGDMAQALQNQADDDEEDVNWITHFAMFQSEDQAFVIHVDFELPEGVDSSDDIVNMTLNEVEDELLVSDICLDKSDTIDSAGGLLFENCLKVSFTTESGAVFMVDGIEYDSTKEHYNIFTEDVMPVVRDYISRGSILLLKTSEHEE